MGQHVTQDSVTGSKKSLAVIWRSLGPFYICFLIFSLSDTILIKAFLRDDYFLKFAVQLAG